MARGGGCVQRNRGGGLGPGKRNRCSKVWGIYLSRSGTSPSRERDRTLMLSNDLALKHPQHTEHWCYSGAYHTQKRMKHSVRTFAPDRAYTEPVPMLLLLAPTDDGAVRARGGVGGWRVAPALQRPAAKC